MLRPAIISETPNATLDSALNLHSPCACLFFSFSSQLVHSCTSQFLCSDCAPCTQDNNHGHPLHPATYLLEPKQYFINPAQFSNASSTQIPITPLSQLAPPLS